MVQKGGSDLFITAGVPPSMKIHGKVLPVTRIEDRDLQPGPVFEKARRLYWDYAHA